jgi:hypothetical protein
MSHFFKVVLVLASASIGSATEGRAPPHRWASEFEVATINVERNATDGDTEIVISVLPADEGLKYLSIRAPNNRAVVDLFSLDRSVLGLREFDFESPEPPGDAILAAYPQGIYKFTGRSVGGEWFHGEARLSHLMPAESVIMSPAAGSEVPAGALRVEWSAVPGLRKVVIELENESVDPEQVLSAELPGDATSFDVPAAFMLPGSEYQVGIAAVGENGNITVVESIFTTGE